MTILDVNTGDTAWVLASAALVLLMTPALAFFYGGMVRSKSVLNMIMMSMVSLGTVGVIWVLYGFSMAFGTSVGGAGIIGNPLEFLGLKDTSGLLFGSDPHQIPMLAFVAFQAVFAIIAVALVSGAAADRMKFGAWVLFSILWATLVYFPAAHWVFAFDGSYTTSSGADNVGGFIANKIGAFDFAGGTAIHINAGISALALALVLGKRVGFGKVPMRPHNLTLVMLGAGLLWFGWFGFNAGSALGASDLASLAWVNTMVATAAAMLAWLAVEKIKDGHPTSLGAASGIVAGLVAITPACGSVSPIGAIFVGVLAGIACPLAIGLKFKWGYDDSLAVVGVHFVGGVVGTLAIGLVANNGIGLFYGGGFSQLGKQALGAGSVMVYAFVVTLIIAFLMDKTMGLRVPESVENSGIDLAEHAETGYDLSPVGYTSYRVRSTLVVPASPTSPIVAPASSTQEGASE
jgi:ammonium transporter, Amt family